MIRKPEGLAKLRRVNTSDGASLLKTKSQNTGSELCISLLREKNKEEK